MIILQSESFPYFIIFHRDTHHYHVTITFQSWVSRSNISLYSTGKTAVSQMILCACEISIQTRFWRHIWKKVVLAHKSSSYERIKKKQVTLVESKCTKTIYINSIRIIMFYVDNDGKFGFIAFVMICTGHNCMWSRDWIIKDRERHVVKRLNVLSKNKLKLLVYIWKYQMNFNSRSLIFNRQIQNIWHDSTVNTFKIIPAPNIEVRLPRFVIT